MKTKSFVKSILLLSVVLLTATACESLAGQVARFGTTKTRRVLFIGNSYTSYNSGIDKQYEGLDPASDTSRIVVDGYTLQSHWKDGNALQATRTGKWNYVVLQEQSQTPVFDPANFRAYAAQFDQAIRSAGARTVLLMTWERPDSAAAGVTGTNVSNAYDSLGRTLGVTVAPAGVAFASSLHLRYDLVLYAQDGHPTKAGTYLAACVLYAAIVRATPVGNPFSGDGVTVETSAFLQQVAAESAGFQ
jgi:hypothetical protein